MPLEQATCLMAWIIAGTVIVVELIKAKINDK